MDDGTARTERLRELMGQRVTVTHPDNDPGTSWTGVLTGRYDEPVVVLELADGLELALPQRYPLALAADGGESGARPGDDEILARLREELPDITGAVTEGHRVPCMNCQASAALADMRAALRCVLLPWLEDQAEPATARRIRSLLETSLDEIEDQIDAASGLDR
jgi:hypothetical protein